jgi:hypothetical protein
MDFHVIERLDEGESPGFLLQLYVFQEEEYQSPYS